MLVLSILVFISSALGEPLSDEENAHLQRECGRTYIRARYTRSVNSKPTARYIAPFTVQLHQSVVNGTTEERFTTSEAICSGTIISSRHVLTSARCLANYRCQKDAETETTKLHLFLPTSKVGRTAGKEGKKYRQKLNYLFMTVRQNTNHHCGEMKDVFITPKRAFISDSFINNVCGEKGETRGDIAIIELAEDIPFSICLQPACLYTKKLENNLDLSLYGFGSAKDEKEYPSGWMRKRTITKLSREGCLNYTFTRLTKDGYSAENMSPFEDEICSKNEVALACIGDRGNGLILKDDYLAHVAAVNSWSPSCLQNLGNYYPDGMMDVSIGVYHHLNWICAVSGICADGRIQIKYSDMKYLTVELEKNFTLEAEETYSYNV